MIRDLGNTRKHLLPENWRARNTILQKNRMAKLPTKHHYLPQFYLKGFSPDKTKLYVFDKKATDEKFRFRYQTTKKIAYENNLYTYKTKDLKKETLEDFFSQIEGMAKTVITKLKKMEDITPMERGHLALFIALLWLRTPTSKRETLNAQEELYEKTARMMHRFPQQKEKIKKFFESRGKKITNDEIDDLIDFATNPKRSKITLKFPPGYWIKQMLNLANDIYTYLAICDWEIRHSVKQYAYLTSDNPVMLIPSEKPHPFYGVGLLTPGVKKVVPLTANMYLVMHEPKKEPTLLHTVGDKDFYRKMNNWTMRNAERLVFSADVGKLQKIVKTKPGLTQPRGKRYRVS